MPTKPHGEKIDELQRLVATLIERVDNMRKEMEANSQSVAEVLRLFNDSRVEFTVLKKDCEALQSWKNEQKSDKAEQGRRMFSLLPNIVGAIIGAILASIFHLLKN